MPLESASSDGHGATRNCNPQAAREMRDFHPLLVLSPKAFNERTGIVIGLPMTTAEYNETNPFALRIDRPGKNGS